MSSRIRPLQLAEIGDEPIDRVETEGGPAGAAKIAHGRFGAS